MSKTGKIRKYKKPLNINLGLIIYGIIFIYIICCIILYFTSKHISVYEVEVGSLAQTNTYLGLALREEQIVKAAQSGYVYFYAREGERVGVDTAVYSVDESGNLYDYLTNNTEMASSLSKDDLNDIKSRIITFIYNFDNGSFKDTYDFKYDLEDSVLNYESLHLLTSADSINNAGGLFNLYNAAMSGILVNSIDGMEALTVDGITADSFRTDTYEAKRLKNNDIVNIDDPVYKVITSEDWSIMIELDKERAEELKDETYLKVKFMKTGDEAWGAFSIINKGDSVFGKLDFTNSMINYATERYIEIELQVEEEKGLKIPKSAIVNKSFYLIPREYITKGGNSNKDGVLKEAYLENGEMTSQFIETSIYASTDTDYYVDMSLFTPGDYILKPDSTDKYAIGKTDSLVGVYNINKGYADFREINILDENDEYCIVNTDTPYGLAVYDHIALDGASVEEDDIIY